MQVNDDHLNAIFEREVRETFVRASGPGGQHVNKASTAVEWRWNVDRNVSLPLSVKERFKRLAAPYMTMDGDCVILVQLHRSQLQNREAARDKLESLIRAAHHAPKVRKKTRPTKASRERRLESKKKRSDVKRLRQGRD